VAYAASVTRLSSGITVMAEWIDHATIAKTSYVRPEEGTGRREIASASRGRIAKRSNDSVV
jgi:hypothetical protein